MVEILEQSATKRLERFLQQRGQTPEMRRLTPDASTREFFRVAWNNKTAVACVYPEKIDDNLPQIDVSRLFLAAGLPVAEIYDFDAETGIVMHEDFGDLILRDLLSQADERTRENLLEQAIRMIAEIQAATQLAFDLDSLASRLMFDEEKLFWELNFFKTHYFESLKRRPLNAAQEKELTREFRMLAAELENYAKYLCHRDFHAANLMIDPAGRLRIIDHQDARLGSAAYDLVSLLLDRITEVPPSGWLNEKRHFFHNARENLGLEPIMSTDFEYEFDLTAIQRCLKANGTFANQTANCGKSQYVQFIEPMFRVVLETCRKLDRFPFLRQIIEKELNP